MSPSYLLQDALNSDMKVLYHLIYEYEKGVRPFVLYTMEHRLVPLASQKLIAQGIDFFFQGVEGTNSVNLFFGDANCVKVMQNMLQEKTLDELSPEEDFILGAILGYNISKQCERYAKRKEHLELRKIAFL